MSTSLKTAERAAGFAVKTGDPINIDPPDDETADWLDRQWRRVLIRRAGPDTYVLSPRRAR